jgi:hypothetical protein
LTRCPRHRWRKDRLFYTWYWGNRLSTCRRIKLDPCLSPCTKINSKWINDFNINPETLNLLQARIEEIQEYIHIGNNFLNQTPIAQPLRERTDKWY